MRETRDFIENGGYTDYEYLIIEYSKFLFESAENCEKGLVLKGHVPFLYTLLPEENIKDPFPLNGFIA